MVSFLIQNLVLFMLFLLALIFIVILIDSLISIRNRINDSKFWKQYRGVYVIAKMVEINDKREIYYVSDLGKNGYCAGSSIRDAITFDNQEDAFKLFKKYYRKGMFILKI